METLIQEETLENENALSSHNEDDFRLRVDSFLAQVSYGNREEFRERRRGICERSRVGAVSSGVLRLRARYPNICVRADDVCVEFMVRREERIKD